MPRVHLNTNNENGPGMDDSNNTVDKFEDDTSIISADSGRSAGRGTELYSGMSSEYHKQKAFAAVLDNLCNIGMDGVIVISDRGVILRVNRKIMDLLDYKQDELVKKKINMILPRYHRNRHDGYLLRYSQTLCPVILNHERSGFHVLRKEKFTKEPEELRSIEIRLKVTEITDGNGQRFFVGVIKDNRVYLKNEIHSKLVQQMYPKTMYDSVMKHEEEISGKDDCTVGFVDLVGFTSHCQDKSPLEIELMLNQFFGIMDEALGDKGRFIKTIGDCYMFVCGFKVCDPQQIKHFDHPKLAIDISLRCLELLKERDFPLDVRVGLCSGTAVFGVFGKKIRTFDLFGECVNIASRVENLSNPGAVTVYKNVKDLTNYYFNFKKRQVEIKGVPGIHDIYEVAGRKDREAVFQL